jgi:hypothetical protein
MKELDKLGYDTEPCFLNRARQWSDQALPHRIDSVHYLFHERHY